jgi:hypothetical protein
VRYSEIFVEAKRLYALGFAVHWLHPRSKRPINTGWTTGPRKPWAELEKEFRPEMNAGVRTGSASTFDGRFLTIIDVDIKSAEPHHRAEANEAVKRLLGDLKPPMVMSGRGGGSRHYYVLTEKSFSSFNVAESKDVIAGTKRVRAWEVSLMSEGRQVVIPPSIHPESKKVYEWKRPVGSLSSLPVLTLPSDNLHPTVNDSKTSLAENAIQTGDAESVSRGISEATAQKVKSNFKFDAVDVDLGWLPGLSDSVVQAIEKGVGVKDRSGYLLVAARALLDAGLTDNEVLSVLTDQKTFLGQTGFDHGRTHRKSAAEWVNQHTLGKVKTERSPELVFAHAPLPPIPDKTDDDSDWRQNLKKTQYGIPFKTIENVVTVLQGVIDPHVIRKNLFSFCDTYTMDTPWGGKKGEAASDDDVSRIQYWLGKHHRFEPPKNTVESALTEITWQGAYDPVKEMLEKLPEWDGVARLDTWLVNHFEARGANEPGGTDYLAQVFRKWMIAMVMRVYRPGAKFDWMPIFEGAQGVGKSSFGKILVGEDYFLDWLPDLQDKESALNLQGMWAVEMGELSQFRKNQLETIKAFLTRTTDKVRPPYGRRLVERSRRCVFFGTTNRDKYLVDETGNRRFKPVMVGRLNFKALESDRLQLFAEAKAVYFALGGPHQQVILDIDGEGRIFERAIQAEKIVEDDSTIMAEIIREAIENINNKPLSFNPRKFYIRELMSGVAVGVRLLEHWRLEEKNTKSAAKALRKLDFFGQRSNAGMHWGPIKNSEFDKILENFEKEASATRLATPPKR